MKINEAHRASRYVSALVRMLNPVLKSLITYASGAFGFMPALFTSTESTLAKSKVAICLNAGAAQPHSQSLSHVWGAVGFHQCK